MTNIGEVVMWEMNGQDNQLWFWDPENREVLRNKQFPDMVKNPENLEKSCIYEFALNECSW